MTFGQRLPRPRYESVASDLKRTLPDDGDNLIARAEALSLAAGNNQSTLKDARDLVLEGIADAPANPRGWTVLCELDARFDEPAAGRCMDVALYIGPFDWFMAGPRTQLAGELWPYMSPESQDTTARRMRLFWRNVNLRELLWYAYDTRYGAVMLTVSFAPERDTLRSLNRWLIRKATCNGACYPPID
jgi:hypothetical protein